MESSGHLDKNRQVSLADKATIWLLNAHWEGERLQPIVYCFTCKQVLRPPEKVYSRLKKDYSYWPELKELGHLPLAEYGHIIPHSLGGPSIIENIRLVCHDCNIKMGSQNLYDYCSQNNHVPVENPEDLMVISAENYLQSRVPERMMTDDLDLSPNRCKGRTKHGTQCIKPVSGGLNYCSVHSGLETLAK